MLVVKKKKKQKAGEICRGRSNRTVDSRTTGQSFAARVWKRPPWGFTEQNVWPPWSSTTCRRRPVFFVGPVLCFFWVVVPVWFRRGPWSPLGRPSGSTTAGRVLPGRLRPVKTSPRRVTRPVDVPARCWRRTRYEWGNGACSGVVQKSSTPRCESLTRSARSGATTCEPF